MPSKLVSVLTCIGLALLLGSCTSQTFIPDQNGCLVLDLFPQVGETVTWSGACRVGYADGYGVMQWFERGKPGSKFTGVLRKGRSEGSGILEFPDRNRYVGEFSDGRRAGWGDLFYAWGDHYEGPFEAGEANGYGTYRYADGSIFHGTFQEGHPFRRW